MCVHAGVCVHILPYPLFSLYRCECVYTFVVNVWARYSTFVCVYSVVVVYKWISVFYQLLCECMGATVYLGVCTLPTVYEN